MTKFELAVKVTVDWMNEDLAYYRKDGWEIENWSDMLNAMGTDSKGIQNDIEYMLTKYTNKQYDMGNEIDITLNDYHELEDENGNFISYRTLTNAIRKELFNK